MQIQVDTREKASEWQRIKEQFDGLGVSYFRSKLYVGDYMNLDNPHIVVDRKKDLLEVCGNVTSQHERFKAELVRAQEHEISVIILIEHGGAIRSMEDVRHWINPRSQKTDIRIVDGKPKKVQLYPNATQGERLYKCLQTISERYNVRFEFCDKRRTGRKIIELLSTDHEG